MAALVNKAQQISVGKAARSSRPSRAVGVVVRAQAADVDRRSALAMVAGAAALVSAKPSLAAYGDSANVFGKVTNTTGFLPYSGTGFALLTPSKWNPSPQKEFPNTVVRYEDNFDAVNNFCVIIQKTDKASIDGYGSPEKFVEAISYLLGKQSYDGETRSEGGFAPNRVSAASLLSATQSKDSKGKTYYNIEILTRTADGDEGGRHQLFKATVSNGNLYLLKVQAGDKRWFKGTNKECNGILNSFTVA